MTVGVLRTVSCAGERACMYRLDEGRLDDFLEVLCSGRTVFAVRASDHNYHLVRAAGWERGRHVPGAFRPVEPLKAVVFPPREFLGPLGAGPGEAPDGERIAVGVKNCDLSALRIHDHVFLESEPVDPLYAAARRRTIIVSCDCTDARESCFCPAVREQPYATSGFDINLAPAPGGIVVEEGSARGGQLLEQAGALLEPAAPALVEARDRAREAMTRRVREQAAAHGLDGETDYRAAVRGAAGNDLWEEFARDCVECGACNFACCTCHCFLLADGRAGNGAAARARKWDACLYENFARVAGGANPRAHRAERLFNRFEKKFDFFPGRLGRYACDGCGRCIEACTGKIDIREILYRAAHAS